MKRKFTLIITCLLLSIVARAQTWNVDVGYRYLFAPQWDEAIRVYNFSRPWNANPQPFLQHGFGFAIGHRYAGEGALRHGFNLGYSYCRSYQENIGLETALHLHLLRLGYVLHLQDASRSDGVFGEVQVSALTSALFRTVNDEALVDDDRKVRALGIGGDLSLRVGYALRLSDGFRLVPIASAGFGLLVSPTAEALLNQTSGFYTEDWTPLLTGQLGLRVEWGNRIEI